MTNWLKAKLSQGKVALGPFCKLTEATLYELVGLAGFDFAIIDMEHGPASYETALNLVRACELRGVSPIIRVPANEEHYILRALDIGAHGVEVPEINNADAAARLVAASRYHPEGCRGLCRFVRAASYSHQDKAEYLAQANKDILVIAHIEGREGLENLDAILAVRGLDVIFIGPYDLSQSLGIPGQVNHPALIEKMEEIVDRSRAKGIVIGTFVETAADACTWINRGVTLIAYSVDVGIILDGFKRVVQAVSSG